MERLKSIITVLFTFGGYVFGGMDTLMSILLIFICIDFFSGFIKAWVLKEFDSSKFYVGGIKKIGILLIVAVATQLDTIILGENIILRTVAVSYYIANEGFSIVENWGALGLPLPASVKDALAKLKGDENDESGENNDSDR